MCNSSSSSDAQVEDIVIVGAGIAGLATALALHRLGIPSLVLEQSDSLRTGGTLLTLYKNGWRALDVLGVGHELRSQFLEIQGLALKTDKGQELRTFQFREVDQSQEVRAVERSVLLQTFADKLPQASVRFSSKLAKIEKDTRTGDAKLELTNGSTLSAKIVIGCDGIRSPIARWLGFSEPKYVGHCAFRGLAIYPDCQPHALRPNINYVYGRGVRAGYLPISPTKVYWFICYNSPSPGPKVTDPVALKRQALDLVKNWPSEVVNAVRFTPKDNIIRSPLEDRWLWPILTTLPKGRVVLAGDAWHPITPNLGQGGCCALEDAVVLAKKLSEAMRSQQSIEDALRSYGDERWPRIFPLTIRANLLGRFLQCENSVVCALRNRFVIPKLLQLGPMLKHTNFACEPL